MLGVSVFIDTPLGVLFPLTLSRQHINPGGGESTPPPVPTVLNVCLIGGTQLGATDLIYVSERVGKEATEVSCCGEVGTDGEGLLGVWDATDVGTFIQVLGPHYVVH